MVYTATLSGSGEVDLTGLAETPEYAIAHLLTAGPQVRTPYDGCPDLVTRVGWFAFGAETDIGFGFATYYRDPIWINSVRFIWGLDSGQHLNVGFLRWYFSPGSEVYLLVGP